MDLSFFKCPWWCPRILCSRAHKCCSRSSNVVYFGINRKRACHFILQINVSNTPFTRWSWLDELALRALVVRSSSARRALVEPARRTSFIV